MNCAHVRVAQGPAIPSCKAESRTAMNCAMKGGAMFGAVSVRLASRLSVALVTVVLASLIAAPLAATQVKAAQGRVQLEWLGHEFYRLTSTQGTVIVTSPQLGNADGPVAVGELERTDFVLVPNS